METSPCVLLLLGTFYFTGKVINQHLINKINTEAQATYYTVMKHNRHLKTRAKCRKHEPQVSVFYISQVFSNVCHVLSQCNTQLRLLHLLYDIGVMSVAKNNKTRFLMFYTLIRHRFLTNQSMCRVLFIL